jgi:hypothetical protein
MWTKMNDLLSTPSTATSVSNEATPLLSLSSSQALNIAASKADSSSSSNPKELWAKLRGVTLLGFSRRRRRRRRSSSGSSGAGAAYTGERKSVRLPLSELVGLERDILEPADGLSPLAAGGTIVLRDGYRTASRPPSTVKSLPAYAPFQRQARHRSFYLWWTNEFRHWWKSSRLLVRLAGLWTLAQLTTTRRKLSAIKPSASSKSTHRALRLVKKLGRGGDLAGFLNAVQPVTRTIRIVVAVWRWLEAAQCRRLQVGLEEAMVRTVRQ